MLVITHTAENIDRIDLDGRAIYLVGTAHVSASSAELVSSVIGGVRPDAVAVELCESRFQSLQDPDRWRNTDILTVLREGRGYVLLAQLLLAAFQKKLGGKLNVKPGAEMVRAMEAAREYGAALVLADRDVRITLKRTWASLGFLSMFKLLFSTAGGLLDENQIEEQDIERLKTADALAEVMREFAEAFPSVRRTLIEERDQYLAMKIKHAPGSTVVAVVGAGHVTGILKWFDQEIALAPLEIIPPPKLHKRILSWLIPGLVVAMIIYGAIGLGPKTSFDMLSTWFWINGVFAASGALLAFAHPLAILTAFVAAPFTALHPLLASGWVAGIVEAILRKPRVADLASIADDAGSLRGWWRNRATRILQVMALTNLTGSIGTFVGAWMVARLL